MMGSSQQINEMSKSVAIRDDSPYGAEEREAILIELRAIIASPHFCNSKRYPALLRYVVENTLAGRSDLLKERTLGVEVFDRSPTYDTNADTVVRFTAAEVRKRLLLYYSEHHSIGGIRITLPSGSYIPEFLQGNSEHVIGPDAALGYAAVEVPLAEAAHVQHPADEAGEPEFGGTGTKARRWWVWPAIATTLLVIAVATMFSLRQGATVSQGPLEEFWAPVIHDHNPILICTGGVVFNESNRSGVITADKDSEYPFVSMQIASALVPISALIERSGATAQLVPAPTTPLSELREHSVILLGGYNNRWAMRLLASQPFQFTPEPVESITDRAHPEVHWARDPSIPYSNADDYAIVARFRDTSTGSWVVALAGLGRNGTEAAAQFATSPEHMRTLEEQIPGGFGSRDIIAVLKARVIDGKTGAPSILAVRSR
jgi:hypothetical protein